jgi:hypothetical protein
MSLDEVLALATQQLTQRLQPARATGAGLDPRTQTWLLLKDAGGVVLSDLYEDDDHESVLQTLSEAAEVELVALLTLHSRSELLLAARFRTAGIRVASACRSHVVPGASRFDPLRIAPWEPI